MAAETLAATACAPKYHPGNGILEHQSAPFESFLGMASINDPDRLLFAWQPHRSMHKNYHFLKQVDANLSVNERSSFSLSPVLFRGFGWIHIFQQRIHNNLVSQYSFVINQLLRHHEAEFSIVSAPGSILFQIHRDPVSFMRIFGWAWSPMESPIANPINAPYVFLKTNPLIL
jgi:hypothetical protein